MHTDTTQATEAAAYRLQHSTGPVAKDTTADLFGLTVEDAERAQAQRQARMSRQPQGPDLFGAP